jgi:hypothetical protein
MDWKGWSSTSCIVQGGERKWRVRGILKFRRENIDSAVWNLYKIGVEVLINAV